MLRSVDPTTGRYLESLPEFEPEQLAEALDRASACASEWRFTDFEERGSRLRCVAKLLLRNADEHALTMALEMGKPVRQGRAEVEKCARVCEFYAEHAESFLRRERIESDSVHSWVQFDPLGVVLGVMPWNFPYWQVFRFAAPALMAGNVVLLKHASNVPRCAQAIERTFRDAGFPRGSFQNLPLSSNGVADLVGHPTIRAVSLTGSEWAGQEVAAEAGRALKKVVLELGGSDPFIVLEDARVAQVAAAAAQARSVNTGQSCIAAKRFLVPASIERSFVAALKTELEALRVGDPRDESTDLGPLARADLLDDLDRQVRESLRQGATLVTGGARIAREGFFYQPTLLAGVRPGMRVADEETFGPVAAVITVSDEEEAIRIANASRYGLGASVWGRDPRRALAVAEQLEAGCVAINAHVRSDPRLPFGGVKCSGFGRELGREGIRELVNVRSVQIGQAA